MAQAFTSNTILGMREALKTKHYLHLHITWHLQSSGKVESDNLTLMISVSTQLKPNSLGPLSSQEHL